jgi:excisionase family DNA binding protein
MNNDKILLTAAEVSELTGFAEGTIRHFVSAHRIPVVRISARCVRFRRCDVDLWLEQHLVPATDPDRKESKSSCKAPEKSKAA